MRRRGVLSSFVVACGYLLGGCLLFQGSPEVDDITVYNRTDSKQTVTVEVTETDSGQTVLSQTIEIDPSGSNSFTDPITEPGTYRITVVLESDESDSHRWSLPNNDEAIGLSVYVNQNSIGFQTIAA